jgi:cytochrome c peroxidase
MPVTFKFKRWLFPASVQLSLVLLIIVSGITIAADPGDSLRSQFQRPDTIPFPTDNPYTPEKATLGKMLFFDTRLSRDQNLNCASCHNPSFGWEVPFAGAIGAGGQPLGRHANTAVNLAWTSELFWDGRARSLEDQARGPIEADVEMDLPLSIAVERLERLQGYQEAFARAYPVEGLTEETIVAAIATYERTLVTGDTPFDRWVRGDEAAISDQAKSGFQIFNGKAQCANCHSGWNFTDDQFHDIGINTDDEGRFNVTGNSKERFAFKTPGLREIAARAPYMHNGKMPTLEAVIAHYISGGVKRPSLSSKMQAVSLNGRELQDLVAFLNTLSSSQRALVMPQLPAN